YRDTAFIHKGLVQIEGRGANLGPAWTVFDKGAGAARVFVTVVAMLVRPGTGFAFIQHRVAVGAVVRHEDDDGVVVLAALFQVLDHAADLCVHGFHHGGVDSHTLAFDALLFWAQLFPAWPGGIAHIALHVLGHQTQLFHAFQTLFTQHVIACVVAAFIFAYV